MPRFRVSRCCSSALPNLCLRCGVLRVFVGFEGKLGGEDEGVVVRFEIGPVVCFTVLAAVLPSVAG